MNPNSNLRELLISKKIKNEKNEKVEKNETVEKNEKVEKSICFSQNLIYSNTLISNLNENLDISQINNNLYFCCYYFQNNSNKPIIKYGLTLNENKTLSFPKIKTNIKISESTTSSEIMTRIKTYINVYYGLNPKSIDTKGFLHYSNNCYCFFEVEKKTTISSPGILWASLHEICNLQKLAKNNIENNIIENNIIQPENAILFFEHPFLIPIYI